MNAADTSTSSAISACTPLTVVSRSSTAAEFEAFINDVSTTSTNIAIANNRASLGLPATSLTGWSLGLGSVIRDPSSESAGARTPVASLVTGGLVLATLIVLAPLFSELPKAVLGAIIIGAVVFGMIDIPELRRLYRVTRFDFWIAVIAIVLSVGVLAGVVVGVILSLGWLIYVATQPSMPLLGREPDTQVFRDTTSPGRKPNWLICTEDDAASMSASIGG